MNSCPASTRKRHGSRPHDRGQRDDDDRPHQPAVLQALEAARPTEPDEQGKEARRDQDEQEREQRARVRDHGPGRGSRQDRVRVRDVDAERAPRRGDVDDRCRRRSAPRRRSTSASQATATGRARFVGSEPPGNTNARATRQTNARPQPVPFAQTVNDSNACVVPATIAGMEPRTITLPRASPMPISTSSQAMGWRGRRAARTRPVLEYATSRTMPAGATRNRLADEQDGEQEAQRHGPDAPRVLRPRLT